MRERDCSRKLPHNSFWLQHSDYACCIDLQECDQRLKSGSTTQPRPCNYTQVRPKYPLLRAPSKGRRSILKRALFFTPRLPQSCSERLSRCAQSPGHSPPSMALGSRGTVVLQVGEERQRGPHSVAQTEVQSSSPNH